MMRLTDTSHSCSSPRRRSLPSCTRCARGSRAGASSRCPTSFACRLRRVCAIGLWNPDDPRLFTPPILGVGWSINLFQVAVRAQALLASLRRSGAAIRSLHPARWCSGSTKDFGSLDPGSNPGRAGHRSQYRIRQPVVETSPSRTALYIATRSTGRIAAKLR